MYRENYVTNMWRVASITCWNQQSRSRVEYLNIYDAFIASNLFKLPWKKIKRQTIDWGICFFYFDVLGIFSFFFFLSFFFLFFFSETESDSVAQAGV